MNKQTEALKMAIEALSQDEGWFEPEAAIQACKDALASNCEALEQPAQEPVEVIASGTATWGRVKPSWQGLSDDERHEVIVKHVAVDCTCDPYEFARAIEQALKEKNER